MRRAFITLIGGSGDGAAAVVFSARTTRMPVVGVVRNRRAEDFAYR
jgi:hypothetical protein